jgi:hypothetical protein
MRASKLSNNEKPIVDTLLEEECRKHEEILASDVFGSFSGKITYDIIPPGAVLCRYAQQADQSSQHPTEPGRFWLTPIDLPLNKEELRTKPALPPTWNQDGILEVAVIPEGGVAGYWGTCASQPADPQSIGAGYLPGGITQYFIPRSINRCIHISEKLKGCIMVIPETHMPIADATRNKP